QENRITGANGYGYIYDGDGNRVEKVSPPVNPTSGTLYWYMTPGVVAETDLAGNNPHEYVFFNGERIARKDSNGLVYYYFSDHLKTASVVTDAAGVIKSDSDYYPWGGELAFVANDSNHYKFTGKERDGETGLDYFGARYYSNALGRWVSADWSATPVPVPYADLGDPQTLNLYAYVRNIPTARSDFDGHEDSVLDRLKKAWDALIQPASDTAASKASTSALDATPVDPVTGATSHGIMADINEKEGEFFDVANPIIASADPTGQASALQSELKGDHVGVALAVAGPLLEGASDLKNAETVTHHIATNKNIKGGFTAAFEKVFAKADMTLEHDANKMPVSTVFHNGPHPEAYHQMVLDKTRAAVEGKSGKAAQNSLIRALNQIRTFIELNPQILRFP
ncbi:MAG TPA: RHS repeat-associated core domain-containing protein, partial [Candidatus Angelobacter sp.]|nr:RHS repeat-associated core domain-containing protein [Candidatus Angelobacter sp.]